MQERNNYGKIIAITLSVIAAASAIAFVLYRLARNLLAFYADYDKDEEPEDDALFFDEGEELLFFGEDGEEDVLLFEESADADAENAAKDTAAEEVL